MNEYYYVCQYVNITKFERGISYSYRYFVFSEKVSAKERIEFLIEIFRYLDVKEEVVQIRRKVNARKNKKTYSNI